jgi:D-alanyl-D-alanine carboxypeptidase
MSQVRLKKFAVGMLLPVFIGISNAQASTPTQLIRIPAGINKGLKPASASFLTTKLGSPGSPLTAACFPCSCVPTNPTILNAKVTENVSPTIKVTGLKPAVSALRRALDKVKIEKPDLYGSLKTAGAFCARPTKLSNGSPGSQYTTHSWGTAVDFYFGSSMDPKGDSKTQAGLAQLAPYLNAEGFYWGAGYAGSEEDSMHFEASQELIEKWLKSGELRRY